MREHSWIAIFCLTLLYKISCFLHYLYTHNIQSCHKCASKLCAQCCAPKVCTPECYILLLQMCTESAPTSKCALQMCTPPYNVHPKCAPQIYTPPKICTLNVHPAPKYALIIFQMCTPNVHHTYMVHILGAYLHCGAHFGCTFERHRGAHLRCLFWVLILLGVASVRS